MMVVGMQRRWSTEETRVRREFVDRLAKTCGKFSESDVSTRYGTTVVVVQVNKSPFFSLFLFLFYSCALLYYYQYCRTVVGTYGLPADDSSLVCEARRNAPRW